MSWRLVFVLSVVLLTVLVFETSASATCVVNPMQQVVQTSDAVWWGQVTDAAVAKPVKWAGTWKLTVRLDDVLKGPGSEGSSAIVIASGCGPPMTPPEQEQEAPSLVGQRRLFVGDIDGGELVAFSQVFSPQGLSPKQQYDLALQLTGHNPGVPDDTGGPSTFPWALIPWFLGLVAVVLGLAFAVVRPSRRTRRT